MRLCSALFSSPLTRVRCNYLEMSRSHELSQEKKNAEYFASYLIFIFFFLGF